MNEQVSAMSDKAIIGKIDNGINSIHELQSALQVLRMVSDLNKSFMLIDRSANSKIVRLR